MIAQTVDDSLTTHVSQCPWDRSASKSLVSGAAMRIGDRVIAKCWRHPDRYQYIGCCIDGDASSYGLLPKIWDDCIYVEKGSNDDRGIDIPGMKSIVTIVFKSLQQFMDCDLF